MNPSQHGEVFVTDDGWESDLDLGHYERFTDINMSKTNHTTMGKIYQTLLDSLNQAKINEAIAQDAWMKSPEAIASQKAYIR